MKSICLFVFLFIHFFTYAQQQPELITQEKNLGLITKIVYSPDGRYIASANEKDFTIKVWDIRSDKMLGSLPGHSGHIQDLFFDPTGETIYSFGKDDKNYIWDLNEWKLKDSIPSNSKIEKMKLHPDAKSIFFLSEKMEMMRTDLTTHVTEVFIPKQKNTIHDFCVSEKFLILGFLDGNIQVWDLTTKKQVKKWSNSGKVDFLFVDQENLVAGLNPGIVHTYSLTDYSLKADFQSPARNVVAFNAKTNSIAFADAHDHLMTMNYLTGEKTNSWEVENSSNIRSLSLSPDGSALAVSGFKKLQLGRRMNGNNVIQIWDIKSKRIVHTLKGEVEALDAFAFGETENKLFVLRGSSLHIWDLNSAERIATTTLHERKIEMKEHAREAAEEKKDEAKEKVENSNTNDLIGIASGGLGGLKDRAKNKLNETKKAGIQETKEIGKATFTRLGFQENRILVSRTGKYLVTALTEDEIRLYEFKNGIPEHVDFIRTKQKEFYDMILDPDEKFLVVGGNGDEPVSIIPLDSTRRAIKLDVNDYENRKLGGVFQTANALAFSPDGKKLIAVFNNGRIVVWEKDGWYKLTDFRLKVAMTMKPFAGFSKDGTKFFINTANGVYTYDFTIYANAPSGKQMQMGDALGVKKSTIEGFPVMTHVALDYVVSITKGAVNFLEVATDKTISSDPIHAKWITDIQVNKFGYAGISLRNGELRIYDPSTGKQRFIMVEEEDNAIFKTPENYYKITKEGQDLVTFRLGKDAFPFEQFDAKYNRPDIVLQAMHSEDANMIKLYKSAYEKRLSKLGLKESNLEVTGNLPRLTVNNLSEIPLSTGEKKLTLNISAKDDAYDLQKIMVWINDVPIYGKNGKPMTSQSFDGNIELTLASGSNKIQIACENSKGSMSLKETIEIECTQKVKPVLYLITIGTSNYKDKKFNLNYAAKDALDITQVYTNNPNGTFSAVKTKTITNEQVTKLNIVGLSTFLKDATIDDVVLVFVAGHGVLDASLDYYYGTYDIDFTKPAIKGLTYLALESLLDGIAPLKKMMFMDTCHSGEVEKEEVTMGGQVEKNEKVKFRDAGTGPVIQGTAGMSPSKMMKELFNDLRRGTGTTVISSAGGTEFAMESEEWKNGLFTYCLLSGLTTSLADLNKDGSIMLSEMQMYLTDEVTKLSGGKQVPTTRIGNISLDYKIW